MGVDRGGGYDECRRGLTGTDGGSLRGSMGSGVQD